MKAPATPSQMLKILDNMKSPEIKSNQRRVSKN